MPQPKPMSRKKENFFIDFLLLLYQYNVMPRKEFYKPTGNPRGRPTKYRPELCQDLVDFFSRPLYITEKKKKWIDGKEIITEEKVPNESPFLVKWCLKHDLDVNTPHDWAQKYPDFSRAYLYAKQLQEFFFAELGIKGDHNGFMTFQTLKNVSGWRDKSEVELTEVKLSKEEINARVSRQKKALSI